MRKLNTLTFSSIPSTQSLPKGSIVLGPRKRLPYITLKFSWTLANASGGAVVFTDPQVTAFLAALNATVRHGQSQTFTVFNAASFTRIRQIARDSIGQDWRGVSDATTGFKQSIPNAASRAVVLYADIPLGVQYKDDELKDACGMGWTQGRTLSIDITHGTAVLPTGVTISGNPTVVALLPERPALFDYWENVPQWIETDETRDAFESRAGLHILYAELTNASAASPLSNLRIAVGGEVLHEGESAADIAADFSTDPGMPTAADLTTDMTVLVAYNTRTKLREMVPGPVQFADVAHDMSTKKFGDYFRPNLSESEIRNEMQALSALAGTSFRAVSLFNALGVAFDDSLKHYFALALVPPQEAEARDLSGIETSRGDAPRTMVSSVTAARLAGTINAAAQERNQAAASQALARVAAQIPGGNTDPVGFRRTGSLKDSNAIRAVARRVGING